MIDRILADLLLVSAPCDMRCPALGDTPGAEQALREVIFYREIGATGHVERLGRRSRRKREISGWPARRVAGPLTDAPRRRNRDRRTLRHQIMAMLMDVVAISVVAFVRSMSPAASRSTGWPCGVARYARRHASLRACIASGVVAKPRVATIFSNAVRN